MGKRKGKDNDGLFEEPKRPCQHKNTRQNEHQIICNDCGTVVAEAPH